GGEYPANFVLRKPSEYRLAGGGGVGRVGAADGSGVDPDGVASVALDDLHDAEALQDREMDSLSGRDVDPIDHRLGPPGQVAPLQARLAEMENTRAERVATPARPTRCIALLHQCRKQMVASGNVELRRAGNIGQRGLATAFGNDFEQRQRPRHRLHAAVLVTLRRAFLRGILTLGARAHGPAPSMAA